MRVLFPLVKTGISPTATTVSGVFATKGKIALCAGGYISGKTAASSEILEKKNIVLNCTPVTPEEAIRACGRLLLESGCIEEGYIQAMLERDKSESVAIGSHVAIPHGDSQSRVLVKKTGLAVITYPDGISWDGERVRADG